MGRDPSKKADYPNPVSLNFPVDKYNGKGCGMVWCEGEGRVRGVV